MDLAWSVQCIKDSIKKKKDNQANIFTSPVNNTILFESMCPNTYKYVFSNHIETL